MIHILSLFVFASSRSLVMPQRRKRTWKVVTQAEHVAMWRLRQDLAGAGVVKTIARSQGRTPRTVYRHIELDAREPALVNRVHRSPKLSYENQKQFAAYMETYGPVCDKDLPAIVNQKFAVSVSKRSCQRYLSDHRLKKYSVQQGPPIKPEHKPDRVKFAQDLLKVLDKAIFIDESTIGHIHIHTPHYWGTGPGQYFHAPFPGTLRSNVVGGIVDGPSIPLEFPHKSLTGPMFARILESILKDKAVGEVAGRVFVMDNALIHGVPQVRDVLDSYQVTWLRMPPYSPDLNPVEHMWAWLKQRIGDENQEEEFSSVSELDRAASTIWNNLVTKNVMKDFRKTLASVIESNGEYTGA